MPWLPFPRSGLSSTEIPRRRPTLRTRRTNSDPFTWVSIGQICPICKAASFAVRRRPFPEPQIRRQAERQEPQAQKRLDRPLGEGVPDQEQAGEDEEGRDGGIA